LFRSYLTFVLFKGLAMGIVATLLNVEFARALILVLVSAVITGLFGVIVAMIQSQADRRVHDRLDNLEASSKDIRGKVGADRRETDPHETEEQSDSK
jgi:hypothetical protein